MSDDLTWEMLMAAMRKERQRIARLVSRYNYVDGKAAARHIRQQGAQRDKALAASRKP